MPFTSISAGWIFTLMGLLDDGRPLNQGKSHFYLAFCAVEHDDPAVFRMLLSHLYGQRRKGSWHYFIAGLHERNPLAQVLKEYR